MGRPLSEIISGLDLSAIEVDATGRIFSSHPEVNARLAELREVLSVAAALPVTDDANGVQCFCGGGGGGGPIQSGCGPIQSCP